ncbi:assimilatory sulfite reductase (NADPH) flavoprotein subunit [Buchnera aphidicola str. APS (Acyrthosiphon pisum)]|uniref:Sulfite reductase [NADPH] flavoprotein alpha-component n=1 Tax=Buchnera aphidicola subsp. Acyrthosiphon pisum (strain APS) TaxID=107806 RepID=CYSJ_BUCAI|nr:assimilatory sulfite reductase (NADPH) flavoprotein subunit [Buchnera aphidicola]P57503.1 RecName: Full=Sulfite reductase [NADPH] flavoprotein alpha-component; Short=SiR-FP [Buchnera aphidicola str. APS (Acyrthosiphon pisum)]pir/F84979/ sulfite reductase (NADPH2) (EC 1.8.1.2) [imported] - Buchnera sp. (strain APS) [Buchnera sp. (in: enterobacteria)]ADP66814.1 sulfite reductase (NADPH) flavoprotein alpha-component [Buchnera aphidicola str. TLW03 (Acyrthosiphon pisum)]ADP67399.1 sulfite reduct
MKNQNKFDPVFPLSSEQLNNLKELERTCTNIQSAWLSGYFWKIANQTSNITSFQTNESEKNDPVITIISASQTGNAKLLSKRLYEYFNKNNKISRLIDAMDYKFKKIKDEKILILIISTQGEGEPPEEALSFYKFIMSKNAPNLNNLYYSVFGLGDTSYNLFCQAGKDFDKRFKELGGNSLLDRFDADIEYEDNYNKWSQDLLQSINSKEKIYKSSVSYIDQENTLILSKNHYTKKNPAEGIILTNQKITGRNSKKDVHHIEIDISNLNIKYSPGDALGVWYKNDSNLVKNILELLSINISETITIKNDVITIFDALQNHFELTNNTKNIIKSYANFSKNKFLKDIISNDSDLENYTINTPLIKMIHDHPLKLSSQQLIGLLRPLTPRLYSISSSQEEIDNEIHITVGVVKKLISGHVYLGGASGYLSQSLKSDDIIKIFIQTNDNFRLPINKNTPIIMISSGTGIAPFRAFMQQRDNDNADGKNWLFFGNPNFTEDFLYQVEWQKYIKKGLITNMNLAWSQDQKNKIYVQDRIRENSQEIWSWIEEGAQIYVCGNASKMAKDVEKALLDIISHNAHLNLEESQEFLNNLRLNKRYKRDVY